MGVGGGQGRRVWVGIIAAVLVCAAAGVRHQGKQGFTPLFWADGDSWTTPTYCMLCGDHLQRRERGFLECPGCNATIAPHQAHPPGADLELQTALLAPR
ncbi:hypothetical protein Pan44_52950 [Caulifigura coniformis]|uniref:Uncharacterized protein n=1 Tax=Caulifigura coniformis TaxID=2527983 RepID=A0A517SM96_9PLAN|nr:hypothetical protein [Caulifigura coniformis]QDT57227.1 hypothetical protein Pan44_52950 [Caulifigura coniformis]